MDSNGTVSAGNVISIAPLTSGTNNDTIDFGFVRLTSYKVTKTAVTASPVAEGAEVHFQITIYNDGDTWITNLPLEDTLRSGVPDIRVRQPGVKQQRQ